MKILLASTSSGSRGGGELYLVYLGRALAQRGHEVAFWASTHPRMDELAATFSSIGRVLRSPYQNTYDRLGRSLASRFDSRTAKRIAAEWSQAGMEVIHLNKQNLEDGLDLLRAVRISGVPSICTIHLTQSARYLRAKGAALRDWVARRALEEYRGAFVTVLENRRRDLADFLGSESRVHVIPNGVPLFDLSGRAAQRAAKRAELGVTEDQLLFIAVGRMVPQKRPLQFLEKAAQIHASFSSSRFLWIGDGALAEDWDRWVAARELSNVIRRLPWQRDVPPYLFAADVFLHVAEFEGLPLAILEALSASLPCAVAPHLLAEMPFLTSENSIAVADDEGCPEIFRSREKLETMGR
ncbi:MAG TPA: glycosyltransferase family 4 protein, partial [Chthoniobacteraceae bacterium]